MTLYRDGERFRRALLLHERQAANAMVRAYGQSWKRINKRLTTLLDQLAAAQASGQPVSLAWLFQQQRLQTLQAQIERELLHYASYAEPKIAKLQREAVASAQRAAEVDTMAALGTPPPGIAMASVKAGWTRLSREALTDLVGYSSDGTPLRQLLDSLGVEASQAVRDALITGMATGENPRSIARRVKEAFGGDLVRALRVSRTEVMRSYRTAAVRSYRANSDVVKGWIWNAACDARTCAACWAKHGSTHDFTEELQDHPNGRCSRAPAVKTWAELGFEGVDEKAPPQTGAERFAKLTPAEQDGILGRAGGAAYRAQAVTLEDFATTKLSSAWGEHVQRKSLKGVLGPEEAKRWAESLKE